MAAASIFPLPPLPEVPADADGAIVVAFSGGLDSGVLLHRLAAEPALRARGLRAVHVHHGLQADAGDWAAHCARQAEALQVPLQVIEVQVPRDRGLGLEAAAREARSAALRGTLAAGDVLATAHHLDDQAETFLLRALRASGTEGLGAMRPCRALGQAWQWRPLLALPRAALLDYARAHGIAWIEDPSNALPDPDRNFLRLQVLPLLRQRWPHAAAALARSAALSAEADALLAAEDDALLRTHAGDDPRTLPVPALQALPAARRARVLRHWLRTLGLPPLPARGVERIERDLLGARADAQASFAWSGARVLRWRAVLPADHQRDPLPAQWQAGWDGRAPLLLPDGGRLHLHDGAGGAVAGFDMPLRVHARRGGERIVLPGRSHSHALKQVLQERGVPPWRRAHLPLLSAADGRLLAAGDVARTVALDDWLRARGWQLAWAPPGAGAAAR
ncbi:tRNA lysidine(34) synthetase TilS [Pseudoxanthomonas koreensis]|uniref:tRNA lysidine(34) synthetase TilS n=1 Tax=Pseudoxanthomonas koreensis TaxID=266061 RepID=UPI001391EDAC|nr:tRNA lysidine(34) synthetase TilS [Pseudoxanthomonas koreensis]KAF1690384.1 tRNA lysidine(34) synthetase TilS [Pseudoxanthomonas koreensis]